MTVMMMAIFQGSWSVWPPWVPPKWFLGLRLSLLMVQTQQAIPTCLYGEHKGSILLTSKLQGGGRADKMNNCTNTQLQTTQTWFEINLPFFSLNCRGINLTCNA